MYIILLTSSLVVKVLFHPLEHTHMLYKCTQPTTMILTYTTKQYFIPIQLAVIASIANVLVNFTVQKKAEKQQALLILLHT